MKITLEYLQKLEKISSFVSDANYSTVSEILAISNLEDREFYEAWAKYAKALDEFKIVKKKFGFE